MKELSIEEKAKRYDEALEKSKRLYEQGTITESLCYVFPELKESEDEKIMKELIKFVKVNIPNEERYIAWLEKQESVGEIVSRCKTSWYNEGKIQGQIEGLSDEEKYQQGWHDALEKQGEQKPADKVESRFKVGDWITNSIETVQITGYDIDYGYQVYYKGNLQHRDTDIIEKEYHLWTIQDAKDGDVLSYVTDEEDLWIMIYWSLYDPYEGHVHYHALLVNDNFFDKGTCCICINDMKPATKEQYDLLFQNMKEAGYEWDAEKKELKKIIDEKQIKQNLQDNSFRRMFEQKPTKWSEEDERMFNSCCAAVAAADYYTLYDKQDIENWLKSIKQRIGG